MPIIESVQVAAVPIPLDVVTSFSTRTVRERHYCIVKVRSRDGIEGVGFCYVGSAAGDIAKTAVEQLVDYCINTPEDGFRSEESVKTINKLIDGNQGLY